jgi:sulfatase maturation enzyme AslB (radical SAM superfamily)
VNSFEDILNNEHIRKLRCDMLSGVKNPLCRICHTVERANGGKSARYWNLQKYRHLMAESISNTDQDGIFDLKHFKFAYWQFKISGICNLKCRTCHPTFSTAIYHEQRKHGLLDSKYMIDIRKISERLPVFMSEILKHIQNVEEVHFVGGEPMLMKEHWLILDELIRHDKLAVRLNYHTNLSTLTYKGMDVTDRWRKFTGAIWVSPSVDATSLRNEYIRDGADWNAFCVNLDKVILLAKEAGNIRICPTITVSLLNVLYLDELIEFLLKKEFDDVNFNIVRSPRHYHISLLPENLKGEAIERLNKCINRNSLPGNYFNIIKAELSNIEYSVSRKELLETFRSETKTLDMIRKKNFTSIFPELGVLQV